MTRAAEQIANSVLLIALNRLLLPIATPLVVATILWLGSTVVQLSQNVALQGADMGRLAGEIEQLKRSRESDQSLARQVQQELAGIREGVASQRRSLDRIEQYIDRRNTP